jgi:hypothetical protein
MTIKQPYPMTPGDTLDFSCPWTTWLPAGDTLLSHVVTPGAHITVVNDALAAGISTALVTLAADAPVGTNTTLSFTVLTQAGRRYTRAVKLQAQPG